MTDTQDRESRTEDATDKRISDARLEGNIPQSRELANLTFLLAGIAATVAASSFGASRLAEILAILFGNVTEYRLEAGGDVLLLVTSLAANVGITIGPILLIFAIAGIASNVLQNPPALVWKRIFPDFSRVSPRKGLKRLTSGSGLFEFSKTAIRFWLIAAAGTWIIFSDWGTFKETLQLGLDGIFRAWFKTALGVLTVFAVIIASLTLLDWPLSQILWRRGLRMSHQEIKDERKQMEGDAHIKARRRSIARARVRRRLKRDVARATVVIANPTHFAVALRYVRQEGGAPRVVAKGQDLIALAIRQQAEQQGIPVVEDKVLARSLYSKVEVDQIIPVEFYRAIAEILIRLQSRQRAVMAGRT